MLPNSQLVSITLTRNDITSIVGGYVPGSPFPSWFYVDTPVGAGRYWTIRLHAASTLLGPGTYTTTLRVAAVVGTTVVAWRDVQVSYVVRAFGVTPTALPAMKVLGSSYGAAMPYPEVEVDAPSGTAWTASTSDEWVTLARTTGTGSVANIRVNLDASTKPVGTYVATATFSSSLGTDTATVTLTVSPPKLTAVDPSGATTLVLSGASGHDLTTKTLQVSLDTGWNAHPWTASTAYDWIELVTTSGSASTMTPGTLKVRASAAAAAWPVGTYSGTIELRATIEAGTAREYVVTKTVPVRLTLDDLRILVEREGVGLVSMPGYSSLTRSLRVRTNRGVAESWNATATSEGNWLGVSAHGATADPLILTADPTGLATDTVHLGTVTVSSPDVAVGNVETVRVGLWVGSVDPAAVTSGAFTQWNTDDPSLVADPVAPHVYVHGHQPSEIEVWNVHNRTKVATIQVPNADLGSMTVSGDGRRLFAVDRAPTPRRVVPIDLDPVSVGSAWPVPQINWPRIVWTRANGVPVLLSVAAYNPGSIHDPDTGTAFSGATFATSTSFETILAASADGTRFCALETPLGVSGAGLDLECHLLDASISGGTTRSVLVGPNRLPPPGYGYGFDVALSADGSRIYVAATSATSLHVFDVDVSGDGALKDAGILTTGAYPRAVEVGQDGRIYCGTAGSGGPSALVFAPDGGTAQSTYAFGSVIAPFLAVSADGYQVVTLTAPYDGYNATRMTTVSVRP
jgi:hypothetical protein